ncbi:MAG: PTS sugar transporter subunit IIC [Coprobacillus cateniformis]|uniref:Permease IIC component n=3 Tax=Longibaculum muris TaxID=1796628 RepID=A0A4R3YVJ1_9FIRM|nr:PTS transporter subunit EIIC [Longibaculum muris]MBS5113403.1 PTS sugar transporter subunit IIC [Coprobacillus cateniformis]MBS5368016.1 PTS sugar transporter subunit IIC [Coprobacillus cateniformis]MCR1888196.1 PTS transporter subunit EIIC [Longibaculum muris]TCV96522.1 PTS system cellobiose-specific IIC component [Longibaculum muris]
MDTFADRLGRIGAWFGQNKYLGAIKNAFQNFMPATIAGAVGVLWTNVLVNDTVVQGNAQGLGGIFKPIMVLAPINTVFAAISFCTISCISVGVVMLVAQEIGEANGETGAFPAVLGFIAWGVVTPTAHAVTTLASSLTDSAGNAIAIGDVLTKGGVADLSKVGTFTGFGADYLGATGLFTALIVGIVALEIYNAFRKMDSLKIKMPEQVPPGVSRAFEVLIPTFLTLVVVGLIGWLVQITSGQYVNDLIKTAIQQPLLNIIGDNIVAVMFMYVLISLFWLVGIHGNNMLSAVKEPIFRPMLYANTALFTEGKTIALTPEIKAHGYYTMNLTMMQMFAEWGGSGVTLGLVIAIFIFSKREDNRAIATLSIVPGLFNINETVTFGIPLVLNPILGIPFILAPVVCIFVGWLLVTIHFCPYIVLEVPWTMPPILLGFLATGGSIMGAISQIIVIVVATLIYIPFLLVYENYQNKQASQAS